MCAIFGKWGLHQGLVEWNWGFRLPFAEAAEDGVSPSLFGALRLGVRK